MRRERKAALWRHGAVTQLICISHAPARWETVGFERLIVVDVVVAAVVNSVFGGRIELLLSYWVIDDWIQADCKWIVIKWR